jgi:hypothetical protein
MDETRAALEPAAVTCLDRTRSGVLNVLIVVGAGIAVSGWILGRLDRGALLWDTIMARRVSIAVVFGLLVASRLILRAGSSRSALRDPETRARRFGRSHVVAAIVGALAVPLGFVYGWAVKPRLEDIGPFWVVALASGVLAVPRSHELAGFDEPIADCPAGGPA